MRKRTGTILSAVIALTVMISAAGCSNKGAAKTEPAVTKHSDIKGLLWKINNKNSTVYLYASYHTMKSDMLPFSKTVLDAYNKSDNLVVECNTSDAAEVQKYQPNMFYEGNDNVYNHLSDAAKIKIDAFAKELNLNMNNFKKYKPYYIYSKFLYAELSKMGFSAKGVDTYFIEKAVTSGKKISGLESVEEQLDTAGGMPDAEIEKQYFIDFNSMSEEGNQYEKIYEAYIAGDEKTLVKLSVDPAKRYPVSYKITISDRNIKMADKINDYLNTKDTYFVIVGAGHLVGSDSVISLLIKKGYKVQRIY